MFNVESVPGSKGFSARQLALVFLTGVAVCGVFFSLGFLVGYNERSGRTALATERVTGPGVIPPTVNTPPVETTEIGTSGAPSPSNSIPPVVARPEANPPTPQPSQPEAATQPRPSPPPAPAEANSKPGPPSGPGRAGDAGGGYLIQVVAATAREDAESLVKILRTRGFPVFLVTPEAAHVGDKLYRVQAGPFASRDDAEKMRARLTQQGFKPFIRH
jgi:cell division septation protein DedD